MQNKVVVPAKVVKHLGEIFGFDPGEVPDTSRRILKEGFGFRCGLSNSPGCPNKATCWNGYNALSRCLEEGRISASDQRVLEKWHDISGRCKGIPWLQGRSKAIATLGMSAMIA